MQMIGGHLPIIEAPQKTIKVRVGAQMLPMFATICPVEIIGSEQSDVPSTVTLVLRGNKLPDGEWGMIFCSTDGCTSTVEIRAIN